MRKHLTDIDKCKKNKDISFYIESCNIDEIPKDVFKLSHLKILDARNNRIKTLQKEIGDLRSLEILDLRNNNLREIPLEISFLNKLEEINLQNNKITELPPQILNLSKLARINIDGNPLTKPPIEVATRGIGAIRNYFSSILSTNENIKLFEAKLLIVGEGNVGKTSLMKSLLKENFKTEVPTTEGIDIKEWKFKDLNDNEFKINIWDFGGQEIYHATHQFFLTKRSIYVFVWNARTDDNLLTFDYWLNIVKLLGDNPPVFVVQNKIDERVKNIDEAQIKKQFNNIVGFHNVSVLNGTNISSLVEDVHNALKSLDHIGDTLPKVWNDIRNELEGLYDQYISVNEYFKICEKFNLDEKQALFLSQYYHDIGVFLHFQDNSILKNIIFLKPEWATNAVYKLIDTQSVILNYGRFSFGDLSVLWKEYPIEFHIHLIELMKKFELCFNIAETENYIIPELLNTQKEDYEMPFSDILKIKYKYEFMPKGIITRLIVKLHDLIKEDLFWKNGIVVERQGTIAFIYNDKFNSSLDISIGGYDKNGLLNIISREIDLIHKSLNYPSVEILTPCNCSYCKSEKEPYYYSYETLKKYKEKQKTSITCPVSIVDVHIDTLIKGIEGKLPKGTIEGNSLLKKLKKCPLGQKGWRDFEDVGTEIIKYLFYEDFNDFAYFSQDCGKEINNRKDLIINNNYIDQASFFGRMYNDYKAKAIIVDFKNYENKLNQNEFYSGSKYLDPLVGNFIMIVSRKGIDENAKKLQKRTLLNNRVLLSINDSDLREMIDNKMKGDDPKKILDRLFFDMIRDK